MSSDQNNLLGYLNRYHVSGDVESLREDFREKFGVDVKHENDLFLFKYNMLDAQWSRGITWECRGSILRFDGTKWTFVCRPFDKFFNQHEPKCAIHDESVFNQQVGQLSMVEKADGTCITLWYDDLRDHWRISTLGTITTQNVGDWNLTFDELFWSTLVDNDKEKFTNLLSEENTYIFELCCEENRILTRYKKPTVFLLGIRHTHYGTFIDNFHQEELVNAAKSAGVNLDLPYRENFTFNNIKNLEDARQFVKDMSEMTELFGEYPEGFVVYDGFKPVCKMKNSVYVSLHHVAGGDIAHTRNVIIDAYFNGEIDDIYDHLTDRMKEFADNLKDKVHKLFTEVEHVEKYFLGVHFETQKDYALTVQEHIDGPFRGFFFQNKEKIISNENDFMDIFTEWVCQNHRKFLDFWKS